MQLDMHVHVRNIQSGGMDTLITCANIHAKTTIFPSRPWEKFGTDLFELNGETHLLITARQGLSII